MGLEHPVYRRSPFTQQSRGCGEPGDFIALPHQFLTAWNKTWETWGDPAKLFVHEWAKLRYGIFDEFGFAGDSLYPNYFKVDGHVVPTGSSDVLIKGSWMKLDDQEPCDPTVAKDCHFVPTGSNDQATCSLGYLPFLPNVQRYCNLNEQWGLNQALPPTKHNIICQARGAKEVIESHDDIRGRLKILDMNSPPNVTIRAVKQPKVKYVLVIESSSSMIKQDLWKWISKAAQKFIRNDLPTNSRLAIVTFSNDSSIQHNLAPLTDESARARIADSIPDKYKVQRSPDQRCVICGVQTAMRQVLDGDESGAHVILVTRGDNDTLSLTDENLILEFARYYQVKFSSILVPEAKRTALSFYDNLSRESGGRTFVFNTKTKKQNIGAEIYHNILEAFYDLRGIDTDYQASIPVTVYSETVSREDPSLRSTGSFAIDSTLGHDTLFGIIVDDPDDHFIKSVSFTDNVGRVYGPYSSLSNDFNVINLKTINFPQDTTSPPFDDVSQFVFILFSSDDFAF